MPPTPRSPLAPLALLALLVAASLPALLAVAGGDRIKDSEELNYEFRVPDTWNWIDPEPFKALGVNEVAERRLVTLADGKTPADGQGGRAMLSVQPVPDTLDADYETWLAEWQMLEAQAKTLDEIPEELHQKIGAAREKVEKALAAFVDGHPEVAALLLSRFGKDPKAWPVTTTLSEAVNLGGLPAVEIQVKGTCANLNGVPGPCEGREFVTVVRKRIYRLAMWIWPTEKDREHLKDDLDSIELNFDIPKKQAMPRNPNAVKPADGGGPGVPGKDGQKPDSKREIVRDLAFGFEVARPARLETREIDRSTTADRELGFEFRAQSGGSDVFVDMRVYRIGRAGATAFDLKQYLTGLWTAFIKQHAEGPLGTYPFTPVSERAPFLSLPDLSKLKEVKRPSDDDRDKVSVSDMERAGVCAEAKGAKVDKEKVHGTWRWCMQGNLARIGTDAQIHYCFSTPERTFVLRITAHKDGMSIYKDDLADIMKSFKILDEPK